MALEKQTAAPPRLSKEELMASPEIKEMINKNNEYWQNKIDSTVSKFKKKIEKMEKLYQKDISESEKEHKAFLKKMKKMQK